MQQLSGGGGIPAVGATIGVNAVNADRAGNFYICDEFQNIVYTPGSLTFLGGGVRNKFFCGGGRGLTVGCAALPPTRSRFSG